MLLVEKASTTASFSMLMPPSKKEKLIEPKPLFAAFLSVTSLQILHDDNVRCSAMFETSNLYFGEAKSILFLYGAGAVM